MLNPQSTSAVRPFPSSPSRFRFRCSLPLPLPSIPDPLRPFPFPFFSFGVRCSLLLRPSPSRFRCLKRKLDEEFGEDLARIGGESPSDSQQYLVREVRAQVEILDSTFSFSEQDRGSAKRAIHVLSELAKNEDIVNVLVDCGAVPVLVKHLEAPPLAREGEDGPRPYEHEVEKGSAFTLGLLAIKQKKQGQQQHH